MCILHVGTGESTCRLCVFFLLLLTFIIFAAVLIFLLLQCSHFFCHCFRSFCCSFVIYLVAVFFLLCTLGFPATGLVFSAAPFVRHMGRLLRSTG